MSDNFTYDPPDGKRFLVALLKYLQAKSESELYTLLRDSTCSIYTRGQFSRRRWDAWYTTIYFYIPVDTFNKVEVDEESRQSLIHYCDTVMPKNVGYDVMNVELSPSVHDELNQNLESDLEDIKRSFSESAELQLPDDIMSKGKEMAEVYFYLYAVENSLRLFIEKIGIENFGPNYFSQIALPRKTKDNINGRKQQEVQNRWVSIRGNSELFYLDFIDLSTLIQNNWTLFREYFPDQAWITSKLNELYSIRNLVAHNSYIGSHERDVLRTTFRSIIKQLST